MEQDVIPLTIKQGATLYEPISFTELDKVTPVDFTGYTAVMKIRASYSTSEIIKTLTSADGSLLWLDRTAAPQIAINLSAEDTLGASFIYPGEAVGDLFLIAPDGSIGPYLKFQFTMEPTSNL